MPSLSALQFLAGLQSSSSDTLDFSADIEADRLLALVRTAVDHGLVALLGRAILDGRLLAVPEPVRSDLVHAARLNGERNQQFQRELLQLIALCSSLGIRPVLLKSTALLLNPREHYLTDRLIGDLDILLPEQDIATLADALRARGFINEASAEADSAWLKHYPRLAADDHLAPIEIHRNLAEVAWRDVLPGQLAVRNAWRLMVSAEAAGLSAEDRLLHSFIHDQLDNRGWWQAKVELRGAFDAAHELMHAGRAYDWQYLEQQLAEQKLIRRFRIWLSWLAQLYPPLRPLLPFALQPEAERYARAIKRGDVFWRGLLADLMAELEQLAASSLYRRRACQRVLMPAAYRERLGRLLARLRHARAPGA
ncbi:MAG: nucleotidyltransferase family protein [Pseudomonadota bacterium]